MLRTRFVILLIVFIVILWTVVLPGRTQVSFGIRRITNTGEHTLNLNPVLSGDGQHVIFESTEDVAGVGGISGFRAVRADLTSEPPPIAQLLSSRVVAPAVSHDASHIALASTEDPLGSNADRNSEIFLITTQSGSVTLRQLTSTAPRDSTSRLLDGNFDPSISNDGRLIAFSSNRDLAQSNPELRSEIFLLDTKNDAITRLTSGAAEHVSPKISGNASVVAFLRNSSKESASLIFHDLNAQSETIAGVGAKPALSRGRAISDDGTRLVYAAETAANQTQVFLFDLRQGMSRQITTLDSRVDDVPLHPTISGDGKRITFSTRRNVIGGNTDRSVELYLFDIPSAKLSRVTTAPGSATAEVISSLNTDGSKVAFNFPRVLSGPVSASEFANHSEIYVHHLDDRPPFGEAQILNGASFGHEPGTPVAIARGSLAVARGEALASTSEYAARSGDGSFPKSLGSTSVLVQGIAAEVLFVSPTQVNFVVPEEAPPGLTEISIGNADEFISRTTVNLVSAAPGVFTITGDGTGEGCILNADTLATAPLDPTNGQLRLTIFATGVSHASDLNITIHAQAVSVESVHPSLELPGLDEIHVLVPAGLRGAGTVELSISADGRVSNRVTLQLGGSALRNIMINEFLADPPDGIAGDANYDGTRSAADDEFVELVNTTTADIDLGGYGLQTRAASGDDILRHRFAEGTVFPAGSSLVVFGGGSPAANDPRFQRAQIFLASTRSLSLLNTSGRITLINFAGEPVTSQTYGGSTGLRADSNQSLTRSPDVTGAFVLHQTLNEIPFSPGTRVNGEGFQPTPPIHEIIVAPSSASLLVGELMLFSAHALDQQGRPLSEVLYLWSSSDGTVASIDRAGRARALKAGLTQITAHARGITSAPVTLLVANPSPSPSPSPVPSPTATASPSPGSTPTPVATPPPSPTPSITPSPSPSPTSTPLPSPSPTPAPAILISEFRTRGPNGASDEFVELYNNSDLPVAIGGWKIRGSSSSGTVTTRLTISVGTVIPARGHFLAANSSGYSGTVAADQTYTSGIANDGGIALTLGTDAVVDQVGLSAGSAFNEGLHLAPLPSDANQSYERRPGGTAGSTQDTGDNFEDFLLIAPSNPQSLTSSPTPGPSPAPTPLPTPFPSPTPEVTPSPSPSPTAPPSPTATPTPSPSPSPGPSPSPSPTASPIPPPSPSPPPEAATGLLISQIYGGGGNASAPFRNDFIELLNAGGSAVDLSGWSVQYASSTGSTWSVTILTGITLQPGQYYLIQEASGGINGASLPVPDALGTIAMAATSGKVALVNNTSALSGVCPAAAAVVDIVGYGTSANCFRGSGPSSAPGNTTSATRKNNGCADTQNNNTDFAILAPAPRNTSTSLNLCPSSAWFMGMSNRWWGLLTTGLPLG